MHVEKFMVHTACQRVSYLPILSSQSLPPELEKGFSSMDAKERQKLFHHCLYGYDHVEKEEEPGSTEL